MFGYVRPSFGRLTEEEKVRFQAAYCGLCRTMGHRCGAVSRLFLNYDLTFLAVLLSEGSPCKSTGRYLVRTGLPKKYVFEIPIFRSIGRRQKESKKKLYGRCILFFASFPYRSPTEGLGARARDLRRVSTGNDSRGRGKFGNPPGSRQKNVTDLSSNCHGTSLG